MFKALKSLFTSKETAKSVKNPEEAAIKNQLTQMIPDMVNVRSVDPDEDIKAPKGAELSYLDAKALKFWDKKRTDYEIPGYYVESAFGRNVRPALQRLLNGGYLVLSGIEKSINLKTVPELKAILAEHELKISGKKAELVYRLTSNLSTQELEELFQVGVYEITPKGEAALKPYSIIFTSSKLGASFPHYRLMKEKEATPSMEDTDILLRMFLQDLNSAQKSRNQEAYRIKSMETANFLNTLGRPEAAMEYYCLSFFMFWYRNTFEFKVNNIFAYEYDAKRIDRCGELCGYSLNKTLEAFQTSLRKNDPFGFCTSRNIATALSVFRKALCV